MFTKHKKEILIAIGLIVTYLLTRLINLTILPIFTDEAIYLRWSQIMATDAALRFLPLTDGKPPLFFWLMMVPIKLLSGFDILYAGRLTSVLSGLLGLSGVAFTAWTLFKSRKISLLASLFYLLSPFTFVYDRMAMADSLLAGLFIWAMGLSIMLVKTARLDVALLLGIVSGLGLLTKTPAIFVFILFPVLFLLRPNKLIKTGLLVLLSFGLAEMFFSILRLFPLFNMIASKNGEFTIGLTEFLKQPFGLTWGNLKSLLYWEYFYLTIPVTILIFYAVYKSLRKNFFEIIILASYFLLPTIAMATFNKVIYPRFLLMFTLPLFIIAAYGLSFLKKIFYLPVFLIAVGTIFMLIVNPVQAPLLQADRNQYIDGWAAGYGITEIRQYLKDKSGTLATEGTFGLMPFSLELYQKEFPNVEIKPYWPLPEKLPPETDYLIVYQRHDYPKDYKLREILRFRQGNSNDYLRLYKVL